MPVEEIVDGVIDVIKKNIVAATDITADISAGDTVISVYNSFQMEFGQEIVLIDYGYDDESSLHYNVMEYATIKKINDTRTITLATPVEGNWLVSEQAFIQKTIGHSPLKKENVLFGDREVIPQETMSITVEPVSIGNEWLYLQGGLSEEYRLRIMVYGKSIETDEGLRILVRYADAVYALLNSRIHMETGAVDTPLLDDVLDGATEYLIADTPENQEKFLDDAAVNHETRYYLQDNLKISNTFKILSAVPEAGDILRITADRPIRSDFNLAGGFTKSEFGVAFRMGTYIYDSRVDAATYGQVSKGSAYIRAAELNWFGKRINEHHFPQKTKAVDPFEEIP